LWQNCIIFQDDRGDGHQWECTFDDPGLSKQFGGFESKVLVVGGVENVNHFLENNGADSGKSVLVLSQASIEEGQILVQVDDVIGLIEYNTYDDERVGGLEATLRGSKSMQKKRRHLASPTGTLNTLVVRVNALDNVPPPAAALSEDIFNDAYCLKSQYARCSYNKLQIQEYIPGNGISTVPTATDAPGVVDVFVDANADGNTTPNMQEAANAALQTMFDVTDPGSLFDIVMFCMPPGMGNWLAYAYIGRWDSYYNNDWCQALSSQMHEVGHNIGLHHSGEYEGSDSVQEYGDQSDMMGFSYKKDDTPVMCFNPAKSWQLGWYGVKQIEIDPNTDLSTEPTSFILNGVVDYDDNTVGRYIVAKVGNFYIGFNRKASFNSGVEEAGNQVTVIEKLGGPSTSAKSKLASKLDVGSTYTIELSEFLLVEVKYAQNDNGKDAIIEVNLAGDPVSCQGEYDAEVVVDLITDNYPEETSWSITDSAGQHVFYRDEFTSIGTFSNTVGGLCRGIEYYFVIEDSYGDGICCAWGTGAFTVRYGDSVLFTGGQFEDRTAIPFTLALDATAAPTISPTASPTKAPTISPTAGPTKAPTISPTAGPTANPTAAAVEPIDITIEPNEAPEEPIEITIEPNEAPEEPIEITVQPMLDGCVDDQNFIYRSKAGKNCDWVGQSTDRKTKIICKRRASADTSNEIKVWALCKATCDAAGINKACANR
jgi:hypothetical protein